MVQTVKHVQLIKSPNANFIFLQRMYLKNPLDNVLLYINLSQIFRKFLRIKPKVEFALEQVLAMWEDH